MPNSLKSLLPCPFCGARPELHEVHERRRLFFWYECVCGIEQKCYRTEDEAFDAWNTRAPIAEGGEKPSAAWRQAYKEIAATPLSEIKGDLYQAVKKRSEEIESLSRQGGDLKRYCPNLDADGCFVKMAPAELGMWVKYDDLPKRPSRQKDLPPDQRMTDAEFNERLAALPKTRASEAGGCVWTVDDDGTWETACGEAWQFTCDGPEENNFRFCHGCGKPVAIAAAPAPGGEL